MSDSDTAGRRRDLQAGADLGPGPGPGLVAGGGGRTVDTVGAGANLRPDPSPAGQPPGAAAGQDLARRMMRTPGDTLHLCEEYSLLVTFQE